jgi:hypothetical protein
MRQQKQYDAARFLSLAIAAMCAPSVFAQDTPSTPPESAAHGEPDRGDRTLHPPSAISEIVADRVSDPRPYYTREVEGIPETTDERPITIDGQLQFRYMYTKQNRENVEDASGFQFRRARVGIEGAVNEWIEYSIEGAFGRNDGVLSLNDATILFKLSDEVGLKFGRFRPEFYREEMVSSKRQVLVDRSLLQSAFGLPRTYGVQLAWEGEWLRAAAGVADQTGDYGPDEDFVYTARVEALLEGKFKYLRDFSAEPDHKLAVMVGAGLLYLDNNLRDNEEPADDLRGNILRWTVDLSAKHQGLSGFAAVVGSQGGEDDEGSVNQYGFLVQGAWRFDPRWEVALRYEYGDADQRAKDLSIISLGLNHYIADHSLKWQNDIGFALNEVNGFWSSTSRGWLTDRSGNDGQIVFRSQLQLLF